MARIAIVTDSTCSLSPGQIEAAGVSVVPLEVVVDGASLTEGVEIHADDVAAALARGADVSTSRPAPMAFLQAYQDAVAAGAEHIVSVHLSGSISGTYESARLAAREAPVPVTVVDSRQVAMGLGFAVLTATELAGQGADPEVVAAAAEDRARRTSVTFYVDTLEYLRKGGRVSNTSAFVGSVLSVKPLLHVVDGNIEVLEKIRTTPRAIRTMENRAVERGESVVCDVAVHHLASPNRAAKLAEHLTDRLGRNEPVGITEVGAVLGAHVGPGLLATVVAPR